MHNHIGNFAAAGEAAARSLLLGGAPMRYPDLPWAFLEGGVAWGANLLGDALGHFEKRNRDGIAHYDPASLDRAELEALFGRHAGPELTSRLDRLDYALRMLSDAHEDRETVDEWAESGIETAGQLIEIFRDRFFFGCEADDPMNALAYQRRLLPAETKLRAVFASDIGHWDVPDIRGVLPEAYELVEKELLSEADFRDFTFADPVRMFTATNPEFFAGTVVEEAAATVD